MVVKICPRCNQRYVVQDSNTDFVHVCNSKVNAVDKEDKFKVGDWEDYTGTGEVRNYNWQGVQNKLWGTRAEIEGNDVEDMTSRGKEKSRWRTRQHLEYIKFED